MAQAIQPVAQNPIAHVQHKYVARRNFFNFLGIKCQIQTPEGHPFLFVHLKAFKLKEDITVYADANHTQPLLSIKARQILDFSAAYDVVDVTMNQKLGALRRKGLKSILRDEWEILDPHDQVVGLIQEDSMGLALLRRFLSNLIPQNYTMTLGGQEVAHMNGTWNPFIVMHTMDLSMDTQGWVDKRLAIATSVLLMTVEGKQG